MNPTPVSDFFGAIVTGLLLLAVLGFCLLWFIEPISAAWRRRRSSPDKLAASKRAYDQRLLQPDWEFYEHHLQRPAPTALRSLFADEALLTSSDPLEIDDFHFILFCALDGQNRAGRLSEPDLDIVPFANSNDDPIYLKPGAKETDAVYITYHDGGETEVLAPDIATFVARLQNLRRND